MNEQVISFESDGLKLVGVLRYPERREGKIPGVLLVHGSMDDDRDGNMLRHPDGRKIYKKNFFLEISKNLCAAGFGTFAWDRRGMGESEGRPEQKGDMFSTVRDTKAALDTLCSQDIVDPCRIAVTGQSAGVYTACRLAKDDDRPKVYVLQGGLYRDFNDLMTFNCIRVKEYAEKSLENLLWVEKNDLWGLALGIHFPLMEKAAKEGKTEYEITYKDKSWKVPLNTPSRKPEYASSKQFKYIQKPVLLIHGEYDLNVPIEDVYLIEKELRANGNNDIELRVIPNADHSFQEVVEDEDTRLRERMSLESFRRPYKREFFIAVINYLRRRL